MKGLFHGEKGFLMLEVWNLVIIVAALTVVFNAMGKLVVSHMEKERWLAAVYLLEGAMEEKEYEGEYGRLSLGESTKVVKVHNWQYKLHFKVMEEKLGLLLVQGRVEWGSGKKIFFWELSRKVLQGGKGHIPYGFNGDVTHTFYAGGSNAITD